MEWAKSTLLKLIAGVEQCDSGSITKNTSFGHSLFTSATNDASRKYGIAAGVLEPRKNCVR